MVENSILYSIVYMHVWCRWQSVLIEWHNVFDTIKNIIQINVFVCLSLCAGRV